MLKNLDPVLNADLLYALRQMGHGDEIAIVDANFPAYAMGPRVVRLDPPQGDELIAATAPLEAAIGALCIEKLRRRGRGPDGGIGGR